MQPDLAVFLRQVVHTDAPLLREQAGRRVLETASEMKSPDFTSFGPADLRRLYEAYDEIFFGRRLGGSIPSDSVRYEATRTLKLAGRVIPGPQQQHFTMQFSRKHLMSAPAGPSTGRHAAGLPYRSRLEFLQIVFEHELVHILEYRLEGASRGHGSQFRDLARRLFGHTEVVCIS